MMKNIFKRIIDNEKIDGFILQLFAVYTVTLITSLLVLGTQQLSHNEIVEDSMQLAISHADSKVIPNAASQHSVVVNESNINGFNQEEDEDIDQGSVQSIKSNIIASVSDNARNASVEDSKKSIKPLIVESTQLNDQRASRNTSVNINTRSVAPPINANVIASTTIQAFTSTNNQSSSSNSNVSSSSVNNARINQGNNTQRSSANRSRSNQPTQTQLSNRNDPESDGDQAVELSSLGNNAQSGTGVTNGTRLDGSVRRECPPLERFLERDRERVVTIQRSLGCII